MGTASYPPFLAPPLPTRLERPPARPFRLLPSSMRLLTPLVGLMVASAALAQDPIQAVPLVPTPTTKQFHAFEQRVGGHWQVQWHPATETPRAIFGDGLPIDGWRENSLVEARRHALQALDDHADLLGLGASDFVESIGARMGRTWSFKFDQHFRGIPCIGGRADVRVNMKGVIAMLGSTAWPIAADFDTKPRIGEQEAETRAWLALDQQPTGVPQPGQKKPIRLVIWGDTHSPQAAPFFLAWEVPVSNVDAAGQGPIGRWYIDAQNGRALHFQNDKHECGLAGCAPGAHAAGNFATVAPVANALVPTTVTVMAWTRTGRSAIDALVNIPAVGLVVTVPSVGTFTTDQNGQFTIDISAPVTITVNSLDGTHNAPIADPTAAFPAATVTVQPGVAATLQILTSGATQAEAAHTSTHYWVHQANEWVRGIVGPTWVSQLNTASAVVPTVNRTGTCNAYYTGNTINFYPTAGTCNNTAFSTVIVHEWGHGLDDRFGGISNTATDGLSEGWGDILGMYIVDHPIVGEYFQTNGGYVRTGLNTIMYGTQTTVHASGQSWMGFAWRLRENLRTAFGTPQAIAISDDIVVGSIVADATNQADAVREVFIADDDDGNLNNGVPHYAQLSAAATTKGIPYPQLQVASVTHTPLLDTTIRYTPRLVNATAAAVSSGSITEVRLVYAVNGGLPQTRVMAATGAGNGYRGMLPGIGSGAIAYHVEATHSSSTVVRTPASGEISYAVTVPPSGSFTAFWTERFDTGAAGWTHARTSGTGTDDWQLGAPNGKTSTVTGVTWIDPASAVSGTSVYGTDLGAGTSNGRYPNNINYYLRSPVINCSGRTGVYVRFKRWLSVETGQYDQATFSVNGTPVWANSTTAHHLDTSWQTVEYALPMADNNASVQLEWRLAADASLNLGGWQLDDVEVGTRPVAPMPAVLQLTPEQVGPSSAMTLSVTTATGPQLFAVGFSDTPGPTILPGIATLLIGSPIVTLSGFTDGAGNFSMPVTSFASVPPGGLVWYSQVVTLDLANNFATSNQHVNLFTP